MKKDRICIIDGCCNVKHGRGYCGKHYRRLQRTGSTESANERHGKSGTKEYKIWKGMRKRCNNPNYPKYENYGGRGINVCKDWDSFSQFLADMGQRPQGLTLDRIDNDRGYSKDNCRWSDATQQTYNSRIRSDNKTGIKGVYMDKSKCKYVASIGYKGKEMYLGSYETLSAAADARAKAERLYYHPANVLEPGTVGTENLWLEAP